LYFSDDNELTGWFVGKTLSFFNFSFLEGQRGSSFVIVEPMEVNTTAAHDHTIPRVKPFSKNTRGYVVFDVAELDSPVGLLTELKHAPNGRRGRSSQARKYIQSKYKYVIRPGKSFPKDLNTFCGNITEVYTNRRRIGNDNN
jgi:hypothetical protein